MLEQFIEQAKKLNVGLLAYKSRENQWDNNRLNKAIKDVRLKKFDDSDKENIAGIKDLKKDLSFLHEEVLKVIDEIFTLGTKEKRKKAAESLTNSAELLGLISKGLRISTSQVRRYLDSMRRIKISTSKDNFSAADLLLQQVKIAYAAGRDENMEFFYQVMKPCIYKAAGGDYEHFEQLLRFIEAIVAYHTYYKGED